MTLEVRRGDTMPIEVTVGQDITGLDLWFTAKRRLADSDAEAIIRKSTDEGSITIPVGTDGIALVALQPSDTEGLLVTTRLYWDVQTVDDQGTIYTLDPGGHGRMVVHADVTRTAPGA